MRTLKKIGLFVLICLSALGLLGGIGLSAYNHQWQFVAGLIVVGVAAFPKVRDWAKAMMSTE